MSKESISDKIFKHKNLTSYGQSAMPSRPTESENVEALDMSLEEKHKAFDFKSIGKIPELLFAAGERVEVKDQQTAFLQDGSSVFEQAFVTTETFDHSERVVKLPFDTEFVLPQTTSASLIQDGQDIVNYLKEKRYNEDLEKRDQIFDVNSLVQEYEDALKEDDQKRLAIAITRLQQLWSHIAIEKDA